MAKILDLYNLFTGGSVVWFIKLPPSIESAAGGSTIRHPSSKTSLLFKVEIKA